MDTTIRTDSGITTLINIFTVEPERQQELVAVLKEGAETWIGKMPGFISVSFHASKDGRRVINYAQWARAQDIEAVRASPRMGPYLQRLGALAQADPGVYDVSYVLHA